MQPNLQSVPFKGKSLQFNDCFIAPNATVIGNVAVGDRSTVWYGAIIRGTFLAFFLFLVVYARDLSFFLLCIISSYFFLKFVA